MQALDLEGLKVEFTHNAVLGRLYSVHFRPPQILRLAGLQLHCSHLFDSFVHV